MTVLKKLKVLVNKSDVSDELLRIYIDRAEEDVKGFCNIDRAIGYEHIFEAAILELAFFYFNRQGIEGSTGYSEGGVSYSFEAGIPQNIKERLRPHVRGRVMRL